jgi:nitronate monooxygenase
MAEPLFTLLPQVVDMAEGIPVVAAGGIADGRGLAAAIVLGGQGVFMGTRFYASQEAEGHPEAKRRIVSADGGRLFAQLYSILLAAIVGLLVIRAVYCATTMYWLGHETELEAIEEEAGRDYSAARERGDFDIAAVIAGHACTLIHDIPPARDIVERTVAEAEQLLPKSSQCN